MALSDPYKRAASSMTIGDTVTLKSGGPAMTVAALLDNVTACPVDGAYVSGPAALCEWFEGETLQRRVWPVACLAGTPTLAELADGFERSWEATGAIKAGTIVYFDDWCPPPPGLIRRAWHLLRGKP